MSKPKELYVNLRKGRKTMSPISFSEHVEYPATTEERPGLSKFVHESELSMFISTMRSIISNPDKAKEIAEDILKVTQN